MNCLKSFYERAEKQLDCPRGNMSFYAWPQAFGSTAGTGGIGGCQMTNFTVYALVNDLDGSALLFCDGKVKRVKGFKPFMWF